MLHRLAYAYNYYNYNVPTSSGSSSTESTATLIVTGIIVLILVVLFMAGLWKTFVKAGRPGWAAIIPLYNSWVIYEIAGKPGWWALIGLLAIIPILGFIAGIAALVLSVIAMLELARRFGKGPWFAIFGLVLFSAIGFMILGFGKAKYEPEKTLAGAPEAPAVKAQKITQSKKLR